MFLQLIIFNYIVIALIVIGTISMFKIKNSLIEKFIVTLMIILSLSLCFLSFTSLPSNYIIKRILSIAIASLPFLSLFLLYYKKINWSIYKIIVIVSVVLGEIYFMM